MNPPPDNRLRARTFRTALAAFAMVLAVAIMTSCDLGSADSVSAVLSNSDGVVYNFAGLYVNPDSEGGPLVFPAGRQSGATLTWMRLLHYGSVIEAFDNANQKWSGRISTVDGSVASFSLRGTTSAGQSVDVVGVLRYAESGNQPTSTMDATWIEPGFSGSLLAQASVNPAVTVTKPPAENSGDNNTGSNGGGGSDNGSTTEPPELELDPQGRWFIPSGGVSGPFTASGGTPPYSWEVSNPALGTISPITGTTVTYTTTQVVGTNIVTVTDSAGAMATAFAFFQ
jgi:hypothetical protein